MSDMSEQKGTTNALLVWGIGIVVIVVTSVIILGVYAAMHQNVNAGVKNVNQLQQSLQQQANGTGNVTL